MKPSRIVLGAFAFTVAAAGAVGAKMFAPPTPPVYSVKAIGGCTVTNIAANQTCTLHRLPSNVSPRLVTIFLILSVDPLA